MTPVTGVDGAVREFLQTAAEARRTGQYGAAWAALEAAHIVGQRHTGWHVRSHVEMLKLAWQTGDRREITGQLARIAGAALVTWAWVPDGNTGRASMSAFASAPVPEHLARLRRSGDTDRPPSGRA
jgi:hypothetical protein